MRRTTLLRLVGILAVAAGALSTSTTPVVATAGVAKLAATGQLQIQRIHTQGGDRELPAISGGTIDAAQAALNEETGTQDEGGGNGGIAATTLGCSDRTSNGNVRVNQDCTYRRQAEEGIIYNPANPSNLVAGQNDSRVGFNQCGIDYSLDNGQHWGDQLPPFRQKLNNPAGQEPRASDPNRHTILGGRGTLHTYDAGSDPMVAFDSQGNAYFGCVGFDVASDASLLYVTRSPKEASGSFFFNLTSFSRRYVVAEDNNPGVFHDKPLLAADFYANSPNRDNVYVTWTVFFFSPNCGPQPNPTGELRYCQSPIFGSMSTDQGHTFSTPEEISGASTTLCFLGDFFQPSLAASSCNFDQGSDPVALPNGDLEVIFNNGNTALDNPNAQQLGVHCQPSGKSPNGTAHLNCGAPAKVGDDIVVGEPNCNFGRGPEECIPGVWIRTNDFPRISHNAQNGHLYAAWQDYRNGEFDIQLAQSTDGGLTWNERGTVNPDRGMDHYFAAVDRAPQSDNGDRVGSSYFRTNRVPNENVTPPGGVFAPGQPGVQAEPSDYALAGGSGGHTPFAFQVLSPQFAPPDGIQAGFNGDYSGLTINRDTEAHPIWSDTRNTSPFPETGVTHDEDVFTMAIALPGQE